MDLAELRRNYARKNLLETDVLPDPVAQFARWMQDAIREQVTEPNAMSLATVATSGRPSLRTVLLKSFDNQGFTFYTNLESRKGQEMGERPQAALLFTWLDLERQIRLEGHIERVDDDTARQYFQGRPKGSQIGAWASPQSRVISGREVLESAVAQLSAQYADAPVLPLPPFWGGYRLVPDYFEFWQGRESRLHDRLRYTRSDSGAWVLERLAP